jgi:hypothetical protein
MNLMPNLSPASFRIVLINFFVLLGLTTIAQNPKNYYVEEPRTFYGGLVAGANFTQVDGDSYKGYRHIGINAGVVAFARFSPEVAGSIEILFSQKGATSNGTQMSKGGITFISKQNIKLNYAEIPVQLNYYVRKKSSFGGGFSYSRLISSKEEIQVMNPTITYDPDKHPFNKDDINLILSGQVHLYEGFYIGLRFQYSLISIRKNGDLLFGNEQQFNNVFALRMMYLF